MDTATTRYQSLCDDYYRIEQVLVYLEENFQLQPSLKEAAAQVHLSEYHMQRLFTRWVGISPKRFLQFLTKEHAKELLRRPNSLLETSYESGLSGPGRLYDLFVTCEAVTPGEYKNQGEGLSIEYGFHPGPFGECLIAVTERGVCGLLFVQEGNQSRAFETLRQQWPYASFGLNPTITEAIVQQIFPIFERPADAPLHLFIKGTNFQLKVWEALLKIPAGNLITYSDIATWIGRPQAARAVGNAVAHNPIAYLIPCHRVIRKLGEFGNYRWGTARKKAILGWEMSRSAV